MKRFWTLAEARALPEGHIILLDGKHLHLPNGELVLPFANLALAIAAEWADAGETFGPDNLPLTGLASSALYRVGPNRADMIARIAAYGANDLLCYRADIAGLATWQDTVWQPWLDWAERELGVQLATTDGLLPINQSAEGFAKLGSCLEAMTDYQLAGLGVIVPALGSLILGLAVAAGGLPPEQACELAMLEELWQEQRWGADPRALARREKIFLDVAGAARFMVLCVP